MDPLTSFALIGTARQAEPAEGSGGLVDAVLGSLRDLPMERRVLLAAGARATAAMAGRRAARSEQTVQPAPAETLPECSERAARVLADLLRGHHPELLPEALALLASSRHRLPHALLPEALRVRGDGLRDAMRLVLGERGAWLARLNDTWSWAAVASNTASFEDLERAWTDGTATARRDLILRARQFDPARARGWLEATWSSEKADERAALLAALKTGLSAADEPFLEAQLRDRASGVREAAQGLLAHLPESAFVKRMTTRADAMLEHRRSLLAAFGKRGSLTARPPESVDEAAERDGLTKPPQGLGAKAFWLARALAAVPVAHWSDRFGAKPADLVAAAAATEWACALCEGWTRAALLTGEADWLGALWDFFVRADERAVSQSIAVAMATAILQRLPAADASRRTEALFHDERSRVPVSAALQHLPRPWARQVGALWLEALRSELRRTDAPTPMLAIVGQAAIALPAECFASALEPLEVAEPRSRFERALSDFTEIIRIRQNLVQELVR